MQVQIKDADARVGLALLGDVAQFPSQIHGECRGTHAAGQTLHSHDHTFAIMRRFARCRPRLRRRGGHDGCGFGLPDALDRGLKLVFRQGVGDKFIGTLPQQLVQGRRADILGDQDDANVAAAGLMNDFAQKDKVVLILLIHCDGHEFQRVGVRLRKEGQRLAKAQITPGLTQNRFHVLDQQIEILNVATDRASHDRRRFRRVMHTATHLASCPLTSGAVVWQGRHTLNL